MVGVLYCQVNEMTHLSPQCRAEAIARCGLPEWDLSGVLLQEDVKVALFSLPLPSLYLLIVTDILSACGGGEPVTRDRPITAPHPQLPGRVQGHTGQDNQSPSLRLFSLHRAVRAKVQKWGGHRICLVGIGREKQRWHLRKNVPVLLSPRPVVPKSFLSFFALVYDCIIF